MLEMLVLAVAAIAGYQGQLILRHGGPQNRTYAIMLIGVAVVGAVAFSGLGLNEEDRTTSELLSIVTVGSFVCLVLVPSMLRDQARRALGRDQVVFARWLLTLRELLQPGAVARQERDYVNTIAEVRAGRVDAALADLQERRTKIDDPAVRRALDERIVLALLFARRWQPAIQHFERRLLLGDAPITAQLTVEMIGAFGEQDDLDRASEMLVHLENSPMAADPVFGFMIMRARMIFLAFVGRPADVRAIVGDLEKKRSRRQVDGPPLASLSVSQRAYWMAVAHSRAGDRAAAESAFALAADKARDSRARKIVEDKLASLEDVRVAKPSDDVNELADRVSQAVGNAKGTALPMAQSVLAIAPVTVALCAVNVLVAAVLVFVFDDPTSTEVLVGVGANVNTAVLDGELWRLHAATFLHAHGWHLMFNVYGLWILGKLLEPMMGRRAFFAVYALAGLGGSIIAVLFSTDPMVSVGASGAVMGLLGALLAEIYLRRKLYPPQWRRMMLGNIVFVVFLQLGLGMLYPAVDQAAHIGGFVVGLAVAPMLSPRGRVGSTAVGRGMVMFLVVAGLASFAYSGVGLAQKRTAQWQVRNVGGLSLKVPGTWVRWAPGSLLAVDHGHPSVVGAGTKDRENSQGIEELIDYEVKAALDPRDATPQPTTVTVDGWTSREVTFLIPALDGDHQPMRAIFYVRIDRTRVMVVSFMVPESRMDDFVDTITRILKSARIPE